MVIAVTLADRDSSGGDDGRSDDGGRGRTGDVAASRLPDEVLIGSYRVVYAVEELDAEPRTEERTVIRPYHSKVVSRRDGRLLDGTITDDDGLWVLLAEPGTWQLRTPGRQRPADDLRPIQALRAALDEGLAQGRGADVVLGRTCSVVRIGGLPGGPLEAPSERDHVELCVDETGVMLRERWVVAGRLARSMTATEFIPEFAPQGGGWAAADELAPSPPAPGVPEGVPGLTTVRPLGPKEAMPVDVSAVAGFVPDGPPVVVERNVAGRPLDVRYQQTFVDGPRLVVVEQRAVGPEFQPGGRPLDLGGGRSRGLSARRQLGLVASTITVVTDAGIAVRVRGPDLDALAAFASRLVTRG